MAFPNLRSDNQLIAFNRRLQELGWDLKVGHVAQQGGGHTVLVLCSWRGFCSKACMGLHGSERAGVLLPWNLGTLSNLTSMAQLMQLVCRPSPQRSRFPVAPLTCSPAYRIHPPKP